MENCNAEWDIWFMFWRHPPTTLYRRVRIRLYFSHPYILTFSHSHTQILTFSYHISQRSYSERTLSSNKGGIFNLLNLLTLLTSLTLLTLCVFVCGLLWNTYHQPYRGGSSRGDSISKPSWDTY